MHNSIKMGGGIPKRSVLFKDLKRGGGSFIRVKAFNKGWGVWLEPSFEQCFYFA